MKWILPRSFVVRLRLERLRVGRRLDPVRRGFGSDAGQPIDRYYIERFLNLHRSDIHGDVLEVRDNRYTWLFGNDWVRRSDVLDIDATNEQATLIADLTRSEGWCASRWDCIILTQVLQQIYELRSALETVYRILKPGGVVLVTLPGITQIDRRAFESGREHWRFTTVSAKRLFSEVFPAHAVDVQAYGNVFAATAFLHGVVVEEVRKEDLDQTDPEYELSIAVRAEKPIIGDNVAPSDNPGHLQKRHCGAVGNDQISLLLS